MSITARFLKFMMRLLNVKRILRRSTDRELHARSIPKPIRSVRRKHTIEKVQVNHCQAYWLSREKMKDGLLVYLHGGAFVVGPIKWQWEYISDLSLRGDMAALVIDYRQLPDHPFPAGLNDVTDVLTYILDHEKPGRWFLLGDSAGGNLALTATFKLRDKGYRLPDKIVLMSPFLDASLENPDINKNEEEDPFLSRNLRSGKKKYAPDEELYNPLVSPMFGKLEGLPPILLQVGTSEIMLWDSRKFYKKCRDAGVEVEYKEYEGMFHAFQIVSMLPEAKEARKAQLKFLKGKV